MQGNFQAASEHSSSGRTNLRNGYEKFNTVEPPSVFRSFQHTVPFRILIAGFRFSTRHLPVWLLRLAGIPFVFFFIALTFKNFWAVIGNLRLINPEISVLKAVFSAAAVFKNYSFYLIDLFYISHDLNRVREYKLEIKGLENIQEANKFSKGIILLTSHVGNWEIGGLALSSTGKEINIVYSPDSSEVLESQRSLMRSAVGVKEIPLKNGEFSSLKLLRILQDKGIVALQGDRLLFDTGVQMRFFTKPAFFPKGPVKLALAAESIVLPVFVPLAGYKSYKIIVEKPVIAKEYADKEKELKMNLDEIIYVFEKYIKEYSTQWFTFMPFWISEGLSDK